MLFLQKIQSFFQKKSAGFTLVEIMVSVALFTIVVTISMGALLTIVDTNRKAQTLQLVMNNLNFAVESMVREMREANSFAVDSTSRILTIGRIDDVNGTPRADVTFSLETINGIGTLVRKEGTGEKEALTAEGISVDALWFQKVGDTPARVILVLKGHSTITKAGTQSDFSIQTTVAQRNK